MEVVAADSITETRLMYTWENWTPAQPLSEQKGEEESWLSALYSGCQVHRSIASEHRVRPMGPLADPSGEEGKPWAAS